MSVPQRQLQEELQTAGQGGSENLVSKVISKYRADDKSHALRRAAANGDRTDVIALRKRRYLGRYFAHPMMQNRRAKRDDYKPSAVRVTQRCVP
ncbi:hypothetical protein PsalMR5_01917 [Piscirickettsia salmonis]|uniref:hypothetical protein n=1 Tax=Piscirickettsia salmonis TaxID=1238 RepID=UPI0018ACBC37|nr:hypothetical protein [Piscirickettsia salmonis]QGP54757.1 hypothetical protein PsalSR1_02198 [Piscirickettsia salmonis]QGP59347.1 hypothetical protein PsalBI1_01935 [Piscirickettsia salmonis]QGP64052.1 hypothetical protein PsalMR5_01917 [Piscirickettsia salmonis]